MHDSQDNYEIHVLGTMERRGRNKGFLTGEVAAVSLKGRYDDVLLSVIHSKEL
jgi:hypothetical protein